MKSNIITSAVTSLLFALAAFVVMKCLHMEDALLFSILSALLFYMVIFGFLSFYMKSVNKKYAAFEKGLPSPVFFKANGNFHLPEGKMKNGNIYFCDNCIICACLEETPHTIELIQLQDISRFQFGDVQLAIHTQDSHALLVTTPDVDALMKALEEKTWI